MPDNAVPTLVCANHPSRETMLRCNRCEKPICFQCAVQTPVGYRCRECVAGQQAVYYNAERFDLPKAAAIGLVLSAVMGALAYAVLGGFGLYGFIIAVFAGPAAGGVIAEVIRRGVGRRRARYMKIVAAASVVIGVLLGGVLLLGGGTALGDTRWIAPALFFRLDVLLFAGLAASTVYARLL